MNDNFPKSLQGFLLLAAEAVIVCTAGVLIVAAFVLFGA